MMDDVIVVPYTPHVAGLKCVYDASITSDT